MMMFFCLSEAIVVNEKELETKLSINIIFAQYFCV